MTTSEFEPFDFQGDFNSIRFKKFLKYCYDHNVSDILVQGGDYIWVEVYGRQRRASQHTIKQGQLPALVNQLWDSTVESSVRGGTGADRSLEISGEELGIERGKYMRFRCNFVQARVARLDQAYAITMRLIPTDLPEIENMHLEKDLFEAMYPDMGLVLVCGPTGSGKTTLQAAIYGYAGKTMPDRKVITYEDPIEFILGGTHWLGPQPAQSQIGRDIENFALGLRNAMRRKPSIIGIGEARDLETIDAMIEAGLTGHLCYATEHTESCAETINRTIQVYPPGQQAAVASRMIGCLRVIVVQRLLKTTDGKRVPVREYVIFDRELRNKMQMLPYMEWAPYIRQLLEKNSATIDDKAWELYVANKITKQEFVELAGVKAFNTRSNLMEKQQ